MSTPTRQLVELTLGPGELEKFVTSRRAEGVAWSIIARDLWGEHRISVSHETLRQWFGGDQ